MTREQAIACAGMMRAGYFPATVYTPARDPNGKTGHHLAWMVNEMETNAAMSDAKIMRWLGYIQGALVMCGLATLDDMKEASRFSVYGPAK